MDSNDGDVVTVSSEVERQTEDLEATGSTPVPTTKLSVVNRPVALHSVTTIGPREAGVRRISRRLLGAPGSVGVADRASRNAGLAKPLSPLACGSMNEHHVVRGYRLRPLWVEGCRRW